MKAGKITLTIILFLLICFSCNSGETDTKTEVNDSEKILNKNKLTATDSVRVDSVNHW